MKSTHRSGDRGKFFVQIYPLGGTKFFLQMYNVCVARKLQILEFLSIFFCLDPGHFPTSRGPNFNLIDLNRVSNFSWRCQLSYEILFGGLEWKLDYISQNGLIPSPPPGYLTDPIARVL